MFDAGDNPADHSLLAICRLSPGEPEATTELLQMLRAAAGLIDERPTQHEANLELAMALLAWALGQLRQYHPQQLPLGYHGPMIRSHGWVQQDALELVATQIAGLRWSDRGAKAVAGAIRDAVARAVKLGFLEQTRYDGWRPGMPRGSGWHWAVAATQYGVVKAHAAVRDQTHGSVAVPPATDGEPVEAAVVNPAESSQAVRQLIEALAELRLSTGELLVMSEKTDIFPEPQINKYYEAHRAAEALVEGIAQHLSYGQPNPGHMETHLRQYLHQLGRAMESVTSEWNDRPHAYPLSPETTRRAWHLLNTSRDMETTLKLTSLPPPIAAPRPPQAPAPSPVAEDVVAEDVAAPPSPETQPAEAPSEPSSAIHRPPLVELGAPGEACRVMGKPKPPLTDAQRAVLSALLKAGDEGLSKDALEEVRISARRILRDLRRDPDWQAVILMPGRTNVRYRLKPIPSP